MFIYTLPIGYIATSVYFHKYFSLKQDELFEKMKKEQIYTYKNTDYLPKINDKIVVMIPKKYLGSNLCGSVTVTSVNKKNVEYVTKRQIHPYYTQNIFGEIIKNEETITEIIMDTIDDKTIIAKQLLFPNLKINPSINNNSKVKDDIKILFDNENSYKTSDLKHIETDFEKIIQNNIHQYKTSFYVKNFDYLELKKNLLQPNQDLYVLVDGKNFNIDNSDIIAISDEPNKIIAEKYSKEVNNIHFSIVFADFNIAIGMGILLAIFASKF